MTAERVDHYHHEEVGPMQFDIDITKYSKGGFGYTVKIRNAQDKDEARKLLFELTNKLDSDYPSGG